MMILPSILFFFLGISATFAYPEECPSAEEVQPCICRSNKMEGGITIFCSKEETTVEQLKKVLSSLPEQAFVTVELDGLNLGILPSDLFFGVNVRKLHITDCRLDDLADEHDRPFLGLEHTLEELSIVSSLSDENKPLQLRLGHLQFLRELDISDNNITELSNDWFPQHMYAPNMLQRIYISNNGIKKIGDRVFSNIMSLQELSLDGNRFGNLKPSMFPEQSMLQSLELDNNEFTSLPEDLFHKLQSLMSLSLRGNKIVRLDRMTWEHVWSRVQVIHLEGNPLKCDGPMKQWTQQHPPPMALFGKCASPAEAAGQDLKDFITPDELKEPF